VKHKLNIKPLSVNQAWQGRRFKTNAYKKYEIDCLLLLPKVKLGLPPYQINIEIGYSNVASDIDNALKPILDILQKKYNFDDKHVYKLVVEKKIVSKGNEYILIEISEYETLH
jgi:Holliday junction resolvase RusA-like endonuclease